MSEKIPTRLPSGGRRKTTKIFLSAENSTLRRQLIGWQSIGALANRANSGIPFLTLMNELVRECSQAFSAEMVTILTLSDDAKNLEVAASIGLDAEIIRPIEVDPALTLEKCAQKGLPEWAVRDREDLLNRQQAGFDKTHMLFCQLEYQGVPLGVFCAYRKQDMPEFNEEDRTIARSIAGQVSLAMFIEGPARVMMERERLERDIHFAHALKGKVLPKSTPNIPGFSIGSRCLKSIDSGGDFYDFIMLADGRLAVIVGEISGRGVSAALNLTKIIQLFRGCLNLTTKPGEAITQLNKELMEHGMWGRMVSACLIILDRKDKTAEITRAGSTSVYLCTEKAEPLDCGAATPLAMLAENSYSSTTVAMPSGSSIIVSTDGINKCHDTSGNTLNDEAFETLITECAKNKDNNSIADRIGDHIEEKANQGVLADDVTIISVECEK